MIFERLKSKVVSHLSYLIGAGTDAFVVDPQRDVQPYIGLAKKYGVNIKYIFETHRNEDYIIGSCELADMTGAEIYHGSWPDFKYGNKLIDGKKFKVGSLEVTAIHTPGHTPGCMSFSVVDTLTGDKPVLVCTGDTLFIGDTGRTDFGGTDARREWATNLYESIHNKLLSLGDHVIICPAHGSGSVCGAKIANREISTLGAERLMNPQLAMSREEFISYKTLEHHEYAPYFRMMEKYNLEGATPYGVGGLPKALTPMQFEEMVNQGAIVVDTRPPPAFAAGYIKGSYSIAEARLGFAGWVLPFDKPIILVLGNQNNLEWIITSLASIGYDNVVGYLKGTIVSWYLASKPVDKMGLMLAPDLREVYEDPDWHVLDVRSVDEYGSGHVPGSTNVYVGTLPGNLNKVPRDKKLAVICKSGTRSGFGCSILLRNGYTMVYNVLGGITSWKVAGYMTES
ncbi:MBL fold metallo-hydrolase [Candidatus Bathyarchaeota archaeon]|nr:MBL fold metallo-hydrolase [Candidatus Bathyarchaeota archaeon]MBL7080834.1 MBL fold metallo-hydrolase [Candidatus Bathyarchaeota archaeon]